MYTRPGRPSGGRRLCLLSLVAVSTLSATACTKHDAPLNDSTAVLTPAPADTPAAAAGTAMTPVRGTVAALSDTALTITTTAGAQQIHIVAPLRVYARTPSDLAHVTPNAFVGITSVAQPDGSQRATEIHVFPEELRGTGEGSRMMAQAGGSGSGGGGGSSTMTNGTVSPSRMTNGSVSGSRMTNGAVSSTGGGTTYTVAYQGGTQTIAIPPGVTVTLIAPSPTKLAVGTSVVVLATPAAGGGLSASSVMLAGPAAAK
jgi:hypothetical protein